MESFLLERNSRMTLLESLLWQQHSFGLFGCNANKEQREKERHFNSNRNFRRHSLFLLLAGEWSSFDCSHHEGVRVKISVLFRIVLPTVWKFQMASSSSAKNSALRFADIGTLSKRMIAPIDGFAKMPVVSLEEAVKPLADLVPEIERKAYYAVQSCQEPEDGLTSDESASIMLYTCESDPHEDSLYVILNAILRSPERQKELKPWLLYLRLVLTALNRLPSERCFVNRGVREDLRQQYPIGKSVVWWGFSSCTTSIGVLECEHFFGKTGTRTLFQIECHSGKDVKNHSSMQHEDEILLLPARQFLVKSCLDSGNGLHIIQLKETEPKYPLLEPLLLPNPTPKLTPKPNQQSSPSGQKSIPPKPLVLSANLSGEFRSWAEESDTLRWMWG